MPSSSMPFPGTSNAYGWTRASRRFGSRGCARRPNPSPSRSVARAMTAANIWLVGLCLNPNSNNSLLIRKAPVIKMPTRHAMPDTPSERRSDTGGTMTPPENTPLRTSAQRMPAETKATPPPSQAILAR